MAITGTGTQADPWVVHSYDEIKTASQSDYPSSLSYMKLGNDINCNDYGDEFEWETITLGKDGGQGLVFDLDGHTIKNIMIKSGNTLFTGWCYNYRSILKNGKILNVFGNSHTSVLGARNTGTGQYWLVQNLSISANNASCTAEAFRYVKFESCAIYFITPKLLSRITISAGAGYQFKNCDCYFEVTDWNGQTLFHDGGYNSNTFDNCRVVANIGGLGDGRNNGVFFRGGSAGFVNCVVDVTGYTDSNYPFFNNSCTGVINKDHFGIGNSQESASHDYTSVYGLTACTTAEITSGDALRAKGFTVVNV